MSATSPSDPRVEEQVEEVKRRIDADAAFREQLVADPAGTLRAAGLPEEVAERARVVRDQDPSDDVTGYTKWVVSWKCWIEPDGSKTCMLF